MLTASRCSARASLQRCGPGCMRITPRRQTRSSRPSSCWMMTEPSGDGRADTATDLADGCVLLERVRLTCGDASTGLADGCVVCNGRSSRPLLAPVSTRASPVDCRAGRAARLSGMNWYGLRCMHRRAAC
eukprot:1852227-Alexandrium_andersonii.AAC.1